MNRWEQEPLTNFRRDLVAEDEFRLLVEQITAQIVWRWHLRLAWLVRVLR